MNITPIKTEADYDAALDRISELWGAPVGSPEGDEIDVLATLVEKYEETAWPIEAPDPIAAIEFVMDQKGFNRSALADLLGAHSRASEVLRRKRHLSLSMIRKLHQEWGIPTDVLVAEYSLSKDARTQ